MASEATIKNICPCCGKQEGVPMVHGDALDADTLTRAIRGELVRAGHSRLPDGYRAMLNRKCLRCEFEWRMPEPSSSHAMPQSSAL